MLKQMHEMFWSIFEEFYREISCRPYSLFRLALLVLVERGAVVAVVVPAHLGGGGGGGGADEKSYLDRRSVFLLRQKLFGKQAGLVELAQLRGGGGGILLFSKWVWFQLNLKLMWHFLFFK